MAQATGALSAEASTPRAAPIFFYSEDRTRARRWNQVAHRLSGRSDLSWPRLLPPAVAAAVLAAMVFVAALKEPGLYRGALGFIDLALLGLIAVHDVWTRRAP